MKKEYFLVGIVFSIVLVASAGTRTIMAQNLTESAFNAVKNAGASVNQTASELGKNASSALNNAGASANATMSEVGKNASDTGETLLNQTGEVAKKIVGGAANVLSNISGEIKQGVGAK